LKIFAHRPTLTIRTASGSRLHRPAGAVFYLAFGGYPCWRQVIFWTPIPLSFGLIYPHPRRLWVRIRTFEFMRCKYAIKFVSFSRFGLIYCKNAFHLGTSRKKGLNAGQKCITIEPNTVKRIHIGQNCILFFARGGISANAAAICGAAKNAAMISKDEKWRKPPKPAIPSGTAAKHWRKRRGVGSY